MMKYKDAVKKSMEMLAEDEKSIFIGYNMKYVNPIFIGINEKQLIETPVAENLMLGLGTGLSLVGYKPLVYYERFDFIMNAMDALVNHLDKMRSISKNQFNPKVIIRCVVGSSKTPYYTGHCHTQDFTEVMKKLISIPILTPITSQEVIDYYKFAQGYNDSVMIVEKKDLYDIEW